MTIWQAELPRRQPSVTNLVTKSGKEKNWEENKLIWFRVHLHAMERVDNFVSVLPCVVREHGGQALHGFIKHSAVCVWRLQNPGWGFVERLRRSSRCLSCRLLEERRRAVGGCRRRDKLFGCSRQLQWQQNTGEGYNFSKLIRSLLVAYNWFCYWLSFLIDIFYY